MNPLNKKLKDTVHSDALCLMFALIPRKLHYIVIAAFDEDNPFTVRMKNLKESINRAIDRDFFHGKLIRLSALKSSQHHVYNEVFAKTWSVISDNSSNNIIDIVSRACEVEKMRIFNLKNSIGGALTFFIGEKRK